MIRILPVVLLLLSLATPTAASELTAPEVPRTAVDRMPQNTESFGDGIRELIQNCFNLLQSEWNSALKSCTILLLTAMLLSIIPILTEKTQAMVSVAGAVSIAGILFQNTNGMIGYAAETVWEICEYAKLLCPVLTTALAAQGGIAASAALYAGTIAFITLLSTLVSKLIVPMVYFFLAFSVANCALDEEILKKFTDAFKKALTWILKTLLIAFTTYMSVTGVVSGTTDAATLKAAKVAISTAVPVVGGILSDASESVMVSMGIVKNAVGIYGILAVLAVFAGPFVKVGVQYLLLKVSSAVCDLFAKKNIAALIEDFSTAMGLLLAMVASSCLLVLISTVCFMKGIG